ncbi:MAG TPA: NADH-quinone oxidoreductase subunit J [bacterium]|nr:NADH-quinone oxidoreductase subunit J [bacterium]
MLEAALFYILAAVLVGMALVVITRTNPIASALGLVVAFAALAALYAFLAASLVAIIQILVYAGGIMVLMIFVIMLLNLHPDDLKPMRAKGVVVAVSLLAVLGVVFGPVFLVVFPSGTWTLAVLPEGFGGIFSVGEKIFSDYLFPFEMLSLVLLTAIVGALVLSKRKL